MIMINDKFKKIIDNINFAELCITSKAKIIYNKNSEIQVNTKKASGEKCPVCWKIDINPCTRHS